MARLNALDVVVILALVALLVFVGTREFPRFSDRSFPAPAPEPTAAAQAG